MIFAGFDPSLHTGNLKFRKRKKSPGNVKWRHSSQSVVLEGIEQHNGQWGRTEGKDVMMIINTKPINIKYNFEIDCDLRLQNYIGRMLRSKSVEENDLNADVSSATSPSEDDDKGGKLRRRKESQTRAFFAFFAIVSFLFLVYVVKVNHKNKYIPSKLRSAALQRHSNNHHVDATLMSGVAANSFLAPNSIYKLAVPDLSGNMVSLEKFHGMVTLIVNVACLWGKTKVNYEELSILQQKFKSRGFSVLAFPLSDFHQELPSNNKIQEFLNEEYPQVNFPIFGLSTLNDNIVYQKVQSPGKEVRHNFFKYLLDRNGKVVQYYTKKQDPSMIAQDIEDLLQVPTNTHHKLVTH